MAVEGEKGWLRGEMGSWTRKEAIAASLDTCE
jgi:hypothetical protein